LLHDGPFSCALSAAANQATIIRLVVSKSTAITTITQEDNQQGLSCFNEQQGDFFAG